MVFNEAILYKDRALKSEGKKPRSYSVNDFS